MGLAESLHGAQYVHHDEEDDIVFAWFGGDRVYLYCANTGAEHTFFEDASIKSLKDAIASIEDEVQDNKRR